MPARKLKVFQAQFGFYDTIVAAPSQAAALKAWGVHQDLFASGEAKITADEAAIAAAVDHPGMLLRRPAGSREEFSLDSSSLPALPHAPKKVTSKQAGKVKARALTRPRADRSELDAAEQALSELEHQRMRETADFKREAEELEARRKSAQSAYVEARRSAAGKVAAVRNAYRKDGGTI